MTRLPAENRDVEGLEYDLGYPKYKVGPLCSAPGCSRLADHAHHIWRRSFLAGDYGWVALWNGVIVQNLTGLCWRHHELVTVNKASIELFGAAFVWIEAESPLNGIQLDPQPLFWESQSLNGDAVFTPVTSDGPKEHVHGPGAVEKCPTCSRALPRERLSKEDEVKRPREKWSITVPKDERENGADVLDVLTVECQKLFGHAETKKMRYFTLVQALALVVQHGEQMMGDA